MAGIAVSLLLAIVVKAPPAASQPADASSYQPLDLKPGCWQVGAHVSATGLLPYASPETYKGIYPNATPKELAAIVAQLNAEVDKQSTAAKKGQNGTKTYCPLTSDYLLASLQANPACTKTLQSTGHALHQHVTCPASAPGGQFEKKVDFETSDPEHFTGTIFTARPIFKGQLTTTTETYSGKWIGSVDPHLPNGGTDLQANRPKGPQAVTEFDPSRIVATVHGQSMTATQASQVLNLLGPFVPPEYGQALTGIVEQVNMHWSIALEAERLQLDLREPFRSRLEQHGFGPDRCRARTLSDCFAPHDLPTWQAERERETVLWDSYMAQASTPDEKRQLLAKTRADYKLTVVDPDYFVRPAER